MHSVGAFLLRRLPQPLERGAFTAAMAERATVLGASELDLIARIEMVVKVYHRIFDVCPVPKTIRKMIVGGKMPRSLGWPGQIA
jgi:hypothetical protein